MRIIQLFEEFKVKKVKRIKKHRNKGGVSSIIGNIADEYDLSKRTVKETIPQLEDIMNDLKRRYKKHNIKVDDVQYYNAGAFGMAFIAGDKVIKLTSSGSEASIAKSLVDRKMPGCVSYYDVVWSKKFGIYAILMDKANPLSKSEKKMIDLLQDFLNESDNKVNMWGLKRSEVWAEYSSKERDKTLEMEKHLIKLYKKLNKSNVPTNDLHSDNLGWMKGELVHFDVMGDTSNEVISKLKHY